LTDLGGQDHEDQADDRDHGRVACGSDPGAVRLRGRMGRQGCRDRLTHDRGHTGRSARRRVAEPTGVPSDRQTDRALRLDQRPQQPQPVHRLRVVRLRGVATELQPVDGLGRRHPGAGARTRHKLGHQRRWKDMDLPSARRREVARRKTAHRRRRSLHVHVHHRQRDGQLHDVHRVHRQRRGGGPGHGAFQLQPAESCPSCRSTSGRRSILRPPRATT